MKKIQREKMLKAIREFKTVKKELVSSYQDGYIGKRVYRVTLADGSSRMVEEITKRGVPGDAAVVIPITKDGNVIVVVQSRPNTKETVSVELPAGMVDPGEDYQTTAVREMLEETGYDAENIYELEWHYQDQGCSGAVIKTFVAEGCKKKQDVKLDDDERLTYVEMSFDDIFKMIKNKEISDANTKVAVLEYTLRKKGL
jgi:ADP-ribose pyrophosphatase